MRFSSLATLGLALFLVLSCIRTSQAVPMSSTAPVGPGSFVIGCCPDGQCASSVGRIATPAGIAMDFGWLTKTVSEQFRKMGKSYKSGLDKITSTLNKRFEAQNAKIRQIVVGFGQANEHFRNTLDFGERSKAYLNHDRSVYITAQSSNSLYSETLNKYSRKRSKSLTSRNQVAKRLNSLDNSSISSQEYFPPDATLSINELENLISSFQTISNAFPATNSSGQGPLAQAIQSIRKIKRTRIAAAKSVLADVLSGYVPTVPASQKIAKLTERTGETSRIDNDLLSPVGYLGVLVKARFASDEYRTGKTGIHTMTRTGLLRELASVEALLLAIERRKLRRAKQMAFLEAMQVSGLTISHSLDLWEQYRKVVESK
jgi:hypothetical protein